LPGNGYATLASLEYARIDPFTYTQRKNGASYTTFSAPVGYDMQPNSDRWAFQLKSWFSPRTFVRLDFDYTRHGENILSAIGRLVWNNKRRFGGYTVHVGVVVIFLGIAASSAYQKEAVRTLMPVEMLEVDNYLMRYDGYRLEAVDDHLGAITEIALFDRRSGKALGTLIAEQRMHPNMLATELRDAFNAAKRLGADGDPRYGAAVKQVYDLIPRLEEHYSREVKTPSTEVGIHASLSPLDGSRWGEDFYVIPLWIDPATGQANFRVFINPMVNFIWFGGLIFVIGAHLSVLPDSKERRRLAAALALEERAVA
jgi:cytochrome c-type biogenesis protein CcmF